MPISSEYQNSSDYKEFVNQARKLKEYFDSLPVDSETKQSILEELSWMFKTTAEVILPPRREEILAIVRDHTEVTFDFLQRRFFGVPARTLRSDLKKLAEEGLIIKVGKTRGSFYRVKL